MKQIITSLLTLFITVSLFAQAPNNLSYQAVIRNSSNALVTSSPVGMQISILQGSASGTPVYVETQTTTTNSNGLASIAIGSGTVVSGTFALIDWSSGPYYIKTETDPSGGSNYSITGTSQLMSVPYALYAKRAGNKFITNVADYGIYPDGNDYSQLIRTVIQNANGDPLFFPPGKYVYDGTPIPTSTVNILGVMPIYVSGTLQSGTIFLGKLHFTGAYVSVQGLGVQLSVANDCFRATATINTGKYCRLKDIVTVGADITSAFHSFLVEGFDYLNADNIESYDAYMGQVRKVKSGNLSRFKDYNIAKEAVFLKSDNLYGNCLNLTLNSVQIENPSAGTSTGIKVNSAGAAFQKLSISNVKIQRVQFGVSIISSGGLTNVSISDLNLSNIKVDSSTLKCIYMEANAGYVYKTNISNFDATSTSHSLLETVGNIKYLNVNNLNADIASITTAAEKQQIINIGATTLATNLQNINITANYSIDPALAINYANAATENRIQNYNTPLRGNYPESGISTLSITGASSSIQPIWNSIENVSYIDISATVSGSSISQIGINPNATYTDVVFKKGWKLFIKNSGTNDITIQNNPSGFITNPNNTNITLSSQTILLYVFDGTSWIKCQ